MDTTRFTLAQALENARTQPHQGKAIVFVNVKTSHWTHGGHGGLPSSLDHFKNQGGRVFTFNDKESTTKEDAEELIRLQEFLGVVPKVKLLAIYALDEVVNNALDPKYFRFIDVKVRKAIGTTPQTSLWDDPVQSNFSKSEQLYTYLQYLKAQPQPQSTTKGTTVNDFQLAAVLSQAASLIINTQQHESTLDPVEIRRYLTQAHEHPEQFSYLLIHHERNILSRTCTALVPNSMAKHEIEKLLSDINNLVSGLKKHQSFKPQEPIMNKSQIAQLLAQAHMILTTPRGAPVTHNQEAVRRALDELAGSATVNFLSTDTLGLIAAVIENFNPESVNQTNPEVLVPRLSATIDKLRHEFAEEATALGKPGQLEQSLKKETKDLFIRAAAGLETPADLSDEDKEQLIEDLRIASQYIGKHYPSPQAPAVSIDIEQLINAMSDAVAAFTTHTLTVDTTEVAKILSDNIPKLRVLTGSNTSEDSESVAEDDTDLASVEHTDRCFRELDNKMAAYFRQLEATLIERLDKKDAAMNSQVFGRGARPSQEQNLGSMFNSAWNRAFPPTPPAFHTPPVGNYPHGYANAAPPQPQRPLWEAAHPNPVENFDGVFVIHITDVNVDLALSQQQHVLMQAFPRAKFHLVRYPEYDNKTVEDIVLQSANEAGAQYGRNSGYFHLVPTMNDVLTLKQLTVSASLVRYGFSSQEINVTQPLTPGMLHMQLYHRLSTYLRLERGRY